MRKIGLRGFTCSALATSFSAATASNLYSASISGTSYLRSRSEKMGSTFNVPAFELPGSHQRHAECLSLLSPQ